MAYVIADNGITRFQVDVLSDDPRRPNRLTFELPNGTRLGPGDSLASGLRVVAAPEDLAKELACQGFEVCPNAAGAWMHIRQAMTSELPELREDPEAFARFREGLVSAPGLEGILSTLQSAAAHYRVEIIPGDVPRDWQAAVADLAGRHPDFAILLNVAILRMEYAEYSAQGNVNGGNV